MKDIKALIRIPLTLVIICAATALALAAVNAVTKGPIEEAEQRKKEAAIAVIFGKTDSVTDITDQLTSDKKIIAVYKAGKGTDIVGYVAEVQVSSGYGGAINMMVGIDASGKIAGIEIIEHSETAGLGAAIENDSFRDGFKGLHTHAVIGENVDAISGATISSKAVADGVNAALDTVGKLITGISPITTEEPEGTSQTDTDTAVTTVAPKESDAQTEALPESTAAADITEPGTTGTDDKTEADGDE